MELTLTISFRIFKLLLFFSVEKSLFTRSKKRTNNRKWRDSVRGNLNKLSLTALFAALTAVGAFIKIPLPYVPLTLQTLFVMLAANLLGPKYGSLSQGIYLALGLIGLPIFAQGGGPGYIFQPTFGYLVGYPVGAFIYWE
jgi:biotin transporter BioY